MPPLRFSLSIIICTSERPADFLATMESIRQTDIPAGMDGELIVVENSARENAKAAGAQIAEAIPGLPLRLLYEPCRGKARALNTGIAAARGEILLFTDDDVRVPRGWIAAMTRPLLAGEADGVTGGVRLASHLVRPWMAREHRAWMASTELLDRREPSVMVGANMAFTRKILERVPRFDPELGPGSALGHCEDSLFAFQLLEAGCRLVSVFEPSVEHHFQPARLQRSSFVEWAAKEGRSSAYIAHHWRHETITFPRRRWFSQRLKLQLKRWFLPRWNAPEGAPVWELQHLVNVSYFQQYLRERRRARAYPKRGLVKREGDQAPPHSSQELGDQVRSSQPDTAAGPVGAALGCQGLEAKTSARRSI